MSAVANKSWNDWLHGVPADEYTYHETIRFLEDSDKLAELINLTPNESMQSEESEEDFQEESVPELIKAVYPSVNMDASLQAYVIRRANEVGYPEQILFGMAKKESTCNANATHTNTNGTIDSGMWQINSCNYAALAEHFDMSVEQVKAQIFDPYFNLECALFLLKDCERYHPDNWNTLLMCYNMGGGNARSLWSQGIYSSSYSRAVVRYATELGWVDNNKI